jgi:hypothetical protein
MPVLVAERATREVLRKWRRQIRAALPGLLGPIAAFVVAPILLTFSLRPLLTSDERWFLVGAYSVAVLWFIAWAFSLLTGTGSAIRGIIAERSTAGALAPRRTRRRGWHLVHGLYFADHGDVDHVLICPRGVWAVESKWTTEPAEIIDGHLRGLWRRSPIDQARAGAERIDKALRLTRARVDAKPQPMVVIWGPGHPQLDGGWAVIDGVLVLSAPTRDEVEKAIASGPGLSRELSDRALRELLDLSSRQRPRLRSS